jgi:hypothetical protein
MRSYSHFGTGFEVWNRQQSWFWIVVNPGCNRGSIGAAASEADAVRDASVSIEESSGRQRAGAKSSRLTESEAWMRRLQRSISNHRAPVMICANSSLAKLARYLARLDRASM